MQNAPRLGWTAGLPTPSSFEEVTEHEQGDCRSNGQSQANVEPIAHGVGDIREGRIRDLSIGDRRHCQGAQEHEQSHCRARQLGESRNEDLNEGTEFHVV